MKTNSTQDSKLFKRETVFAIVIVIGLVAVVSYRIIGSNRKDDSFIKAALLLEKLYYANPEAQFNLGTRYYKGEGVQQDYKEAVKWFTKAAEQGYSKAQYILALIYADGTGVIEDYAEAYKWALLAGMNGENVTELKGFLADKMTPAQIADVQKLTKNLVAKNENSKSH